MKNPAIGFLRTTRLQSADELVEGYANFLLNEARAFSLPVQLDRVKEHTKLTVHRKRLARDQRGFTTPDLSIYLNVLDGPTVQKFTLAHELMEVFFFALKDGCADHWMDEGLFTSLCDEKERYCDKGAAHLVMPLPLFRELIPESKLSFHLVQEIASFCEVSLTAVLWRIVEYQLSPILVIFWAYKHKPSEVVPSHIGQGNLFGAPEDMDPPKKMRVERVFSPPGFPFIPPDKSMPVDSSVQVAYITGKETTGYERLDLVAIRGRYCIESRAFDVSGERKVMSLIHL